MKNKTLKLVLILILTIGLALSLTNIVNADVSWDNTTLTVPYGDSTTSISLEEHINRTNAANNMDRHSILSTSGLSILTNIPNQYYSNINVDSTAGIGEQEITIRFEPNQGSFYPSYSSSYYTTITVYCEGSQNLKTVIEGLNGSMANLHTLNTDNVFTTLDGLSVNQIGAIADNLSQYDSLNDAEKALVDDIVSNSFTTDPYAYSNYTQLANGAEAYLRALANQFIKNELEPSYSSIDYNLEATSENAKTIINAENAYDNLAPRIKDLVNSLLSTDYPTLLLNAKAINFVDKYDINASELSIETDNKILDSKDEWETLSDDVKNLVEGIINNSYEDRMNEVQDDLNHRLAEEFIANHLTLDDGTVIVEANNSNYKKILGALDDYNALSDEVKQIVNDILTDLGNTTYPQLLEWAQALEPTPKTGDMAYVMMIMFTTSILGILTMSFKKYKLTKIG